MNQVQEKNALSGGEFLIRESKVADVFVPEDFSEEQQMMAQATTEFIDKEVWPQKQRFEKKDYAFTLELMVQVSSSIGISPARLWMVPALLYWSITILSNT